MLQSLKKKKTLIIITALIVLAIIGSQIEKKDSTENPKQESTKKIKSNLNYYADYIEKTNTAISNFSESKKKGRQEIVNKLEATLTYENLVINKIISVEYLPVLTAINDGIRGTYINKKNEPKFVISKSLVNVIETSTMGKDKLDFVLNTVVLSTPNRGGLPKELIDIFDRYKQKFELYGKESIMYDATLTSKTEIKHPYNMSSIFAYIQPTNQAFLSNVYQSNTDGVSKWFKEDKTYTYPYLATLNGYIQYVDVNNIFKKKAQTVTSNASFWKNYDTEVKARILKMIGNKNCSALQNEFNIAENNSKSQLRRTGTGNAELMSFIDDNMRSIGCYNN